MIVTPDRGPSALISVSHSVYVAKVLRVSASSKRDSNVETSVCSRDGAEVLLTVLIREGDEVVAAARFDLVWIDDGRLVRTPYRFCRGATLSSDGRFGNMTTPLDFLFLCNDGIATMSCDESVLDFVWLDIRFKPFTRAGHLPWSLSSFHPLFFFCT